MKFKLRRKLLQSSNNTNNFVRIEENVDYTQQCSAFLLLPMLSNYSQDCSRDQMYVRIIPGSGSCKVSTLIPVLSLSLSKPFFNMSCLNIR